MKNKCILCGSEKYEDIFTVSQRNIVRCSDCGLIRTNNFIEQEYKKYHRNQDYKKYENHFRNIFLQRANFINKYISKPKRVLEIGCSNGIFLEIYHKAGSEVWGIEPSDLATEAKERGIRVIQSTLEKANLPRDYFNLVIINHTLEHMSNPAQVLNIIRSVLVKGGFVFISVPNFGGISAKIMGEKWPYILPNEHRYHFSLGSIKKMVQDSNLKVLGEETTSGIFEFANPLFGLMEELKTRKKSFLVDLFTFPGAMFTTLTKGGSSLSIIAVK